jgi:hypothetical protein
VVEACGNRLNVIHYPDGIYYVKHNRFLPVLQLSHSQVFALTPTVQNSLSVQCHEEVAARLDLLDVARYVLLANLGVSYVMNAGWHCL